jgi:hypothetical protein
MSAQAGQLPWFQAGVLRGGSLVAGVGVRVLKAEAHNLTAQATQYPVESGKSISDHVILNPNAVDIRFEMPNSEGGTERARYVFNEFIRLRDERKPVNLYTEHASYKNMLIVAFTPEHRAPFKGALVANIRLQQVGIYGEKDSVSAAGGRDPAVLSEGGIARTACSATDGGTVQGVSEGPLANQCAAKLQAEATEWPF